MPTLPVMVNRRTVQVAGRPPAPSWTEPGCQQRIDNLPSPRRFLMLLSNCLTTGKVARRMGVSTDTVRRWITRGVPHYGRVEFLGSVQIGTQWRIPEDELNRFLASIQTTTRARELLTPERKESNGSLHLSRAIAGLRRKKSGPQRKAPATRKGLRPSPANATHGAEFQLA